MAIIAYTKTTAITQVLRVDFNEPYRTSRVHRTNHLYISVLIIYTFVPRMHQICPTGTEIWFRTDKKAGWTDDAKLLCQGRKKIFL